MPHNTPSSVDPGSSRPHPQPRPHPRPHPRPRLRESEKTTGQTVRETLESIAVAFILAFVFRGFIVEAFVIPTGSMAPTLLGRHLAVIDPHTGEKFTVDAGVPPSVRRLDRSERVGGLMSRRTWEVSATTRISPGDRILVLKYPYAFTEPRRWDVVVFKNPALPGQNFIKRLIALPGEEVLLIDGNVYIKPAADQPWSIARKSEHRAGEDVQRAVWQPLYHSRYVPLGERESITDDITGDMTDVGEASWQPPWRIAAGDWRCDDDGGLASADGYQLMGGRGVLAFDFDALRDARSGLYPYNQLTAPNATVQQPVEDIRLAATVSPGAPQPSALSVELATTARLDDVAGRLHRLAAVIDRDGRLELRRRPVADAPGDLDSDATADPDPSDDRRLAGPVDLGPWGSGAARRVELWLVDLEASVWVDGRRVLRHRFNLDFDAAVRRPSPPHMPGEVSITVTGGPAVLRDVELDRDLYYVAATMPGTAVPHADADASDASEARDRPGYGVLVKDGDAVRGEPFVLQDDQFYCLGDNSPRSGDSRLWSDPDPWVRATMLADDPTPNGVVPRELMLGRAFFVYWPAPLGLSASGPAFLPNFADMRFIH